MFAFTFKFYLFLCKKRNLINSKFFSKSGIYSDSAVLEIPADKTDEEIREALENFDVNATLCEICSTTTNNAILNPVLNANPQS